MPAVIFLRMDIDRAKIMIYLFSQWVPMLPVSDVYMGHTLAYFR